MQMLRLMPVVARPLASAPSSARLVASMVVPERMRFTAIDAPLLTGVAGGREKFFDEADVGALSCLAARAADVQPLPAHRVLVHSACGSKGGHTPDETWFVAFADDPDDEVLAAVAERPEYLTGLSGDRVGSESVPGRGCAAHVNEALLGTMQGDQFNADLIAARLGRKPASAALKKAQVGDDTH